MPELQQLEFFLLRYAGDVTKGESINLGVVAIAPDRDEAGYADVRFIRNWRRLRCFDPLADSEELLAIEREIRLDLQDPQRRAELIKRLHDSWSNSVQIEAVRGCLTQSPALELEKLSAIYLEMPAAGEKRDLTGRQRILQIMRGELQNAGVLELLKKDVPVSEFTKPGDPMKLDFGYGLGSDFKFLHAVSLVKRVESGMMLAARFPKIAVGMQEKNGVKAWLMAIVDDDLPKLDEVNFALEMMKESGIVIAQPAEMPRIAEGIRLELKA